MHFFWPKLSQNAPQNHIPLSLRLNEHTTPDYVAQNFPAFDQALRDRSNLAWGWLEQHLRPRFYAWVVQRTKQDYPQYMYARHTIKEEVHASSIFQLSLKYTECEFSSLDKLMSYYFRIGDLQLKQYVRKHYLRPYEVTEDHTEYQFEARMFQKLQHDDSHDAHLAEAIEQLNEAMAQLSTEDQTLMQMYLDREPFVKIAQALNISAENARKRKSRIITQLKAIISKVLTLLLLFL